MLAALQPLHGEYVFQVDVVDVDANPDLVARFDELVPVLALGDETICHYFLDEAKVREVLGRIR